MQDERKYKDFLRAYVADSGLVQGLSGLTAVDLERNTRIRRGLEVSSMSDEEARDWVALL